MTTRQRTVTISYQAHKELLMDQRILDVILGAYPAVYIVAANLATVPLEGENDKNPTD